MEVSKGEFPLSCTPGEVKKSDQDFNFDQTLLLRKFDFFNLKSSDLTLQYNYYRVEEQLDNSSATLLVLNNIEFDYYTAYNVNTYVKSLAIHPYPMSKSLYYTFKRGLSEETKEKIRAMAKNNELNTQIELYDFLKPSD